MHFYKGDLPSPPRSDVLEFAEELREGRGGEVNAWRGRQNAHACLQLLDRFFKVRGWVECADMRGSLEPRRVCSRPAGAQGVDTAHGWPQVMPARLLLPTWSAPCPPAPLLQSVLTSSMGNDLQDKDLALPQHADRAHKLLADNMATVQMSYDVY